jgi:hypothetical protein
VNSQLQRSAAQKVNKKRTTNVRYMKRSEICPARALRAFPQAKMMPPTPPEISSVRCKNRLCEIAAPDTGVQSATDLGVVVRSEDLGVASLALVGPAVGLGRADTVKTGEGGDLAEPATDKDVLEVVSVSGGKDLAEGAGVELVDHLAVGGDNRVHGVGLELLVVCKSLQAQLRTPSVNDALVAGIGSRRSRGGRGGSSLGAGGSGCLRLVDLGDSRDRGALLVDNGGGHDGSLVDGRSLSGLGLLLLLGEVDGMNDSLVDDVDVLDFLDLLGAGPVGNSESRAGKGEDGSGGAHFEVVEFVEVDNELTGVDWSV